MYFISSFVSRTSPQSHAIPSNSTRPSQNFACTLAESELSTALTNPDGSQTPLSALIDRLNLLFTIVFAAELLANALAHWPRPFLSNPWSHLDAFIVAMSVAPYFVPGQNTGILRILRAFRILRLFRRVPSLRKIVVALTLALPVSNVFCILFLLMGICAASLSLSPSLSPSLPPSLPLSLSLSLRAGQHVCNVL